MKRLLIAAAWLVLARTVWPLDVTTDTTWSGDLRVTDTVTVLEGATLTIDAGTTLQIAASKIITIRGRLVAEGTPDEPILFTRLDHDAGIGRWAKFRFVDADGDSRLAHCNFRYGDGWIDNATSGDFGVVTIYGSRAALEDCDFREYQRGDCLAIFDDSDVVLRRCYLGPGGEGVHGIDSDIEIDSCIFESRVGRLDGSDISGHRNVWIHDSIYLGSDLDDGCDFDDCNGIVERCWFFDYVGIVPGYEDRAGGVTMNDGSAPIVRFNVFVNCRQGIIAKGNTRPYITNCDFIDCPNAIAAYEAGESPYRQVGFPVVRNCIIWNSTNTLVLGVDSGTGTSSTVDIDYCDVWSTPTLFADDPRTTVGSHIISADPLFIDGSDDGDGYDLHLTEGSPCIGTGENGIDQGAFPYASRARLWRRY